MRIRTKKHPRKRATAAETDPYDTLWFGEQQDEPLHEALHDTLAFLDDYRTAEQWLLHQSVPYNPNADIMDLTAGRRHFTSACCASESPTNTRMAMLDNRPYTSDDTAIAARRALAHIACKVERSTKMHATINDGTPQFSTLDTILIILKQNTDLMADTQNAKGEHSPYAILGLMRDRQLAHMALLIESQETKTRRPKKGTTPPAPVHTSEDSRPSDDLIRRLSEPHNIVQVNDRTRACLRWITEIALDLSNQRPDEYTEELVDWSGEFMADLEPDGASATEAAENSAKCPETTDERPDKPKRAESQKADSADTANQSRNQHKNYRVH